MKTTLFSLLLLALPLGSLAQWNAPKLPAHKQQVPELKQAPTPGKGTPAIVWDQQVRPSQSLRTVPSAETNLFYGRKLYGAMVNSDLWANYSIVEVPYGIYSFDMGDNVQPDCHISDFSYDFQSGAWGRNRHYGIAALNMLGSINGSRNITIDTQSWSEVRNHMFDTSYGTYSLIASVMTYDPTDDTFYGFRYKEDLTGLDWVKVNLETDEMEQIAAYRGTTSVMALAAGPDGQMYYIDALGDLYTLNKKNGRSSLVANTGVTPAPYNQTMAYDSRTGMLLWAAQGNEGSALYCVDPTTAQTQRVMLFRHNEQFVSLYQTDNEAPALAPAAVTRPQLTYSAPGSLEGTISFSVPSRTYDGSTLADAVNLNVWLDGENLQGVNVNPGERINLPVTLTEGNHYVAITLDNEAGFSPLRQIYQYAGYDTPEAVSEVLFAQADGQNTVSWKAPSAGINAGYIDFDQLTYDVVRMPDSVTVATGLRELTYTEPTPSDMNAYCYRIIAINEGHRSAYSQSNRILCGDSFTVPYQQSFADPTTLADYFTVYDLDGDGATWRQGYTTEVRMDYFHQGGDADDWLISPSIRFEAQMMYRFTMNMKIFTQTYPEDFEVLVGTDPTDLSTFRLVAREEQFTRIANEFADYEANFLIPEAGEYHMAVRYCSKVNGKGSLLMIHDFRVDAVGPGLAPAQVQQLSITPDADNQLQATLTFVAPSIALDGTPLLQLSRILVYRDGGSEPVHVFEAPAPGSDLSWTDTQLPSVGIHSYTVVAENEAGLGETLTCSQFIGIYTAPYFTDFEDRTYANLWSTEKLGLDDPNDWYGWKWTENYNTYGRFMTLDYYAMDSTPLDFWLISPAFRLEADAVYTIQYDASMKYDYYEDMVHSIYLGTEAASSAMTTYVADMPSTGYGMETVERILVNAESGRYHLGFNAQGHSPYNYYNVAFDNFHLTYRTNAYAPFEMTGYESKADATAALRATLSFYAPTVNYYRQELDASEDLIIKVYCGKNATQPTATLTARPGQQITWVDEAALHGFNYYTITCENSHGQGETIHDTLFVGRDVPDLVGNLYLHGSADNVNAVIEWEAPTQGKNGGVVLTDEMTYSIYQYDPVTYGLTLIADGIRDCHYTVEREAQPQHMEYFAISATMPTEGEGNALVSQVVLGLLYDLPFHESFSNASLSTAYWQSVPMQQGATSAGVDNPVNSEYNGCPGPQDEDEGCAYIYNGNQYQIVTGAILAAPKVRLNAAEGNELHFWAYHFPENPDYEQQAFVQVIQSCDDRPFDVLSGANFTLAVNTNKYGNEPGWREHVVNLDALRGSYFVSLGFMGITSGYMDVIYLDNISIVNANAEGISAVTSDARTISRINYYDASGRELIMPRRGSVCIRRITYTDGTVTSETIVR